MGKNVSPDGFGGDSWFFGFSCFDSKNFGFRREYPKKQEKRSISNDCETCGKKLGCAILFSGHAVC